MKKQRKRKRCATPCKHYARGYCRDGAACAFWHPGGFQESLPSCGIRKRRRKDKNRETTDISTTQNDLAVQRRDHLVGAFDNLPGGAAASPSPPDIRKRRFAIPCKYYARGYCREGPACPYLHQENGLEPLCKHYARGFCRNGLACASFHQQDVPESLVSSGRGRRRKIEYEAGMPPQGNPLAASATPRTSSGGNPAGKTALERIAGTVCARNGTIDDQHVDCFGQSDKVRKEHGVLQLLRPEDGGEDWPHCHPRLSTPGDLEVHDLRECIRRGPREPRQASVQSQMNEETSTSDPPPNPACDDHDTHGSQDGGLEYNYVRERHSPKGPCRLRESFLGGIGQSHQLLAVQTAKVATVLPASACEPNRSRATSIVLEDLSEEDESGAESPVHAGSAGPSLQLLGKLKSQLAHRFARDLVAHGSVAARLARKDMGHASCESFHSSRCKAARHTSPAELGHARVKTDEERVRDEVDRHPGILLPPVGGGGGPRADTSEQGASGGAAKAGRRHEEPRGRPATARRGSGRVDGALPPGWERRWSTRRQREYFWCAATSKKTWDKPLAARSGVKCKLSFAQTPRMERGSGRERQGCVSGTDGDAESRGLGLPRPATPPMPRHSTFQVANRIRSNIDTVRHKLTWPAYASEPQQAILREQLAHLQRQLAMEERALCCIGEPGRQGRSPMPADKAAEGGELMAPRTPGRGTWEVAGDQKALELERREREVRAQETALRQREEELVTRVREMEQRSAQMREQEGRLTKVIEVKKEKIEEAFVCNVGLSTELQEHKEELMTSRKRNSDLCCKLQSRHAELTMAKSSAHVQHRQIQALSSKCQELEQSLECGICFERKSTITFDPCGHLFCCHRDCPSSDVVVCPVCSAAIKNRLRIYI